MAAPGAAAGAAAAAGAGTAEDEEDEAEEGIKGAVEEKRGRDAKVVRQGMNWSV
jgi:hypothetical protein